MCVLHLGNLQLRNLSEEEGNESVSATQVQLDLREKTKLAFLSSLRTITITISACHHYGADLRFVKTFTRPDFRAKTLTH